MPPSFSDNEGVPPLTVTTSFRLSVSVTVFPTPRSADDGDSTTVTTTGGGSIDKPGRVVTAPDRSATLPAASATAAPDGRFTWVIANVGTVLSAAATV